MTWYVEFKTSPTTRGNLYTTARQWIVIDGKVYDLTKFKDMHPGGVGVLLHTDIGTHHPRCCVSALPHTRRLHPAGQDATEAFYGLHKQEVLDRPQYKRLVIGTIKDEESLIAPPGPGDISLVPYAEPTWLTPGYYSPYFKEVRNTKLWS